jgi:hypothetical protein
MPNKHKRQRRANTRKHIKASCININTHKHRNTRRRFTKDYLDNNKHIFDNKKRLNLKKLQKRPLIDHKIQFFKA